MYTSLFAPKVQSVLSAANSSAPVAPGPVRTLQQVTVVEVDGSTSHGPLNALRVTVQPMELQILQR